MAWCSRYDRWIDELDPEGYVPTVVELEQEISNLKRESSEMKVIIDGLEAQVTRLKEILQGKPQR